jgi:ectoine hydroxylase-related dioxygenase (phytanoyl-CoA dioxygenase family)
MRLTQEQRRSFVRDGYVVVRDVVSAELRAPALRAINIALGSARAERIANYVFAGHENCDPLQHAPELLDLLTESPAFSLAEQLTEAGNLSADSCCQLATRFPDPGEGSWFPTPHVDGIPNRTNGLVAGQLYPFSVLVGVFLSDVLVPESGNFVVFPGGHRVVEDYARDHPDGWFDDDGYGPPEGIPPLLLDRPTEIIARAGDVILTHHQLPHSVAANRSPHIRYAVYYRLVHREVRSDWSQFQDLWRCHPALADDAS